MNSIAVLLLSLVVILIAAHQWRNRRRRLALIAAPLTEQHRRIIRRRLPLFNRLPVGERKRLEGLVNRFLWEIKFYGGDGFEITDDVRITIAAQACLLIVNKPGRWFKTLRTIIVYPGAFKSRIATREGHVEQEQDSVRSGESWRRGPVILSWDHAAYGAFIEVDGQNVVFHEFAHQLDDQTGMMDGAPRLDKTHAAGDWARAFRNAYGRLTEDVKAGRETFLDAYGATSPAEFFAVATETFFEKPRALREREPDVYDQLAQYYRLDPAAWG